MIRIELNTNRMKLTVKGHAEPEEMEKYRECCAAASAISQAMVYAVSQWNDGSALKALDYKNDPGDLMVKLFPEEKAEKQLQMILTLYGYGLELLAKSHPQSVEMIWDGAKIIADHKEMKKA